MGDHGSSACDICACKVAATVHCTPGHGSNGEADNRSCMYVCACLCLSLTGLTVPVCLCRLKIEIQVRNTKHTLDTSPAILPPATHLCLPPIVICFLLLAVFMCTETAALKTNYLLLA